MEKILKANKLTLCIEEANKKVDKYYISELNKKLSKLFSKINKPNIKIEAIYDSKTNIATERLHIRELNKILNELLSEITLSNIQIDED